MIISLFETVRLSVSISPRNLYNSLKSIKECLILYYYDSKFHGNTFSYRADTTSILDISKEHYSVNKVGSAMVLVPCISSNDNVYLLEVS